MRKQNFVRDFMKSFQISHINISKDSFWADTATDPDEYVFAFYAAFW